VDRSVLPLVAGAARRKYIFQQGSSRTPIVVQVIWEFVRWRKRSLGCRLRVGFVRRLLEGLEWLKERGVAVAGRVIICRR
jgi:hypothetical protein